MKALTIELGWTCWDPQVGSTIWNVAAGTDEEESDEVKERAKEWCESLEVMVDEPEERTFDFRPAALEDLLDETEIVLSRLYMLSRRSEMDPDPSGSRSEGEERPNDPDQPVFAFIPPSANNRDDANSLQDPTSPMPEDELRRTTHQLESELLEWIMPQESTPSKLEQAIDEGAEEDPMDQESYGDFEMDQDSEVDAESAFEDSFIYLPQEFGLEGVVDEGELYEQSISPSTSFSAPAPQPIVKVPHLSPSNFATLAAPSSPPEEPIVKDSKWSTTSALSSFLFARGKKYLPPTPSPKDSNVPLTSIPTKELTATALSTAVSRYSLPTPTPSFLLSSPEVLPSSKLIPHRVIASDQLLQEPSIYQALREYSIVPIDRPPRHPPTPFAVDQAPHLILDGRTGVLFRKLPTLLKHRKETILATLQRYSLLHDRVLLVLIDDSFIKSSGTPITPPILAALVELERGLKKFETSCGVEIVLANDSRDAAQLTRRFLDELRRTFKLKGEVGIFDCWDSRKWLSEDFSSVSASSHLVWRIDFSSL